MPALLDSAKKYRARALHELRAGNRGDFLAFIRQARQCVYYARTSRN